MRWPNADPKNPETVAKFRLWLKEHEDALADYYTNKGNPGIHFIRGFVGMEKQAIAKIKKWLKQAAKAT